MACRMVEMVMSWAEIIKLLLLLFIEMKSEISNLNGAWAIEKHYAHAWSQAEYALFDKHIDKCIYTNNHQ